MHAAEPPVLESRQFLLRLVQSRQSLPRVRQSRKIKLRRQRRLRCQLKLRQQDSRHEHGLKSSTLDRMLAGCVSLMYLCIHFERALERPRIALVHQC